MKKGSWAGRLSASLFVISKNFPFLVLVSSTRVAIRDEQPPFALQIEQRFMSLGAWRGDLLANARLLAVVIAYLRSVGKYMTPQDQEPSNLA